MKRRSEVSEAKLRGGFYTPAALVDHCLDRVLRMGGADRPRRWLEPSAGDGAFVRGCARFAESGRLGPTHLTCVELLESEAARCRASLEPSPLDGEVVEGGFFSWASGGPRRFDVVVGNPPYVRYQFVDEAERAQAERRVRADTGRRLQGVSNLWIPFALVSLARLDPGGVFALVLPAELLHTVSGGQFREFVVRRFTGLGVDLYPRGTFPGILQDVVVVSGRRATADAPVRPVEFAYKGGGEETRWVRSVQASVAPWTGHLLTAEQAAALDRGRKMTGFRPLGELARISVATVTGANAFFTVDDDTLSAYDLHPWALPLLARSAHTTGLAVGQADHDAVRARGERAWLLSFSDERPDPSDHPGAAAYLAQGVRQGLPERYKCRVRDPWRRVPVVPSGALMMTKRSHRHHRLLLNQAGLHTTDTLYRGDVLPGAPVRPAALVAGFHNSLTLLSAELQGRTYGGGVLEMVPSGIARLVAPALPLEGDLAHLDALSRSLGGQRDASASLVETTDALIAAHIPAAAHATHGIQSKT